MNQTQPLRLLIAALLLLLSLPRLFAATPAEELINAIYKGDEKKAILLLKQGADPNVRDIATQPAIAAAAYLGREKTVRALLASHADFRAVDNDGANALHTAAYGGHRAIVELLLASGLAADDRASTDGMSSLAYASVRGHLKVMQLLLDRQANVNLTDSGGNTPLIHAAMRGRTDAVRLLLARGAKVNAASSHGWTPLMAAAWEGHTSIVKLLLKHGADPTLLNSERRSALMLAESEGHAGIVKLLPASPNTLFQAIRAGDRTAVKTLLKNSMDLQARDESGDTPLMAAALNADVAVLELLLKAGADVNATNQAGATPLLRAATFEDKTRLLVAKGADVKVRSHTGNTTLILAARQAGNSPTVKFLLDQGVDPNAMNLFGATALMSAAAAADMESVRLLLDRGANVNLRPDPGTKEFFWGGLRTPLMWAAFQGDEALLKLMLERGAKVNDLVELGGALGQAAWGGHVGVARLLLDAGAQVDQRDLVANYTPLHWAASSEKSSPAVVELLLARGADANAEGGQDVDNYLGVAQTPLMLARRRGDTPIVRALLKAGAKDLSAPKTTAKTTQLASAGAKTAAESVQRALPSLTETAEDSVSTFLRHASKQDCVSCHQQSVPLAALSLAHARHFATDRGATRHQVELMKRSFLTNHIQNQHSLHEVNLQATFHPDPGIMAGYTAMNYELENEPASALTDGILHQLTTMQHADGHWSWNLPRVPIQASDIAATASAVHAIKTFGIPAQRKELASRVQRARTWLLQAPAETSDERIHQLLGLAWAGEKPGPSKKFVEAVKREQRADGGWGQLAGLDSDAYATGQSLYALMEGGKVAASDSAVRHGIDFLLRTQLADGTWHVRTRAHPFQPPMDSGFPHGRDGWISAAGTSWAVMALALATDPAKVPTTTPTIAKTAATAPTVAAAPAGHTQAVEFTRDIQPLLERSCVACHSGEKPKGGFAIGDRASLLKGGNRGEPVVLPGKPDASQLIHLVQDQVEDLEMPPVAKRGTFPAMTKDETARLRAWIDQGAVWPEGVALRASGK